MSVCGVLWRSNGIGSCSVEPGLLLEGTCEADRGKETYTRGIRVKKERGVDECCYPSLSFSLPLPPPDLPAVDTPKQAQAWQSPCPSTALGRREGRWCVWVAAAAQTRACPKLISMRPDEPSAKRAIRQPASDSAGDAPRRRWVGMGRSTRGQGERPSKAALMTPTPLPTSSNAQSRAGPSRP